ncbi:MAG TPA: RecT family recombinase [Actinomycetota bacterium]
MPTNPGPAPVATRALAKPEVNYQEVVDEMRGQSRSLLAMFAGDKRLRDRFMSSALAMLARNPEILRDATPISIVHAINESARLGLEPMTEEAAIVVYSGVATLLPQWRGYVKRIRNSGEVVDFDCQLVYSNDDFRWQAGTDAFVHHVPALEDRGDHWGAYAFAIMPSGRVIPEVMTFADIEAVRLQFGNTRSRNNKPLPWETSWGEMARKTVIRRLAKRLPGAAVSHLLEADARADQVIDGQAAKIRELDSGLSEVRKMALAAVGVPEAEPDDDVGEGQVVEVTDHLDAPAGAEEPLTGGIVMHPDDVAEIRAGALDTAPDPGADPNVAAAMKLSEEEEQLRRNRGR